MKRIFLFLAILIFVFLEIPLAHSKPNSSRKARFVPDEVIIKLKENKKIDSLDLDAGKAKKLTIGKNKHFIKMGLDRLYLLKVKDAIEAIRVLEKHPSVEYVEPNYIVTAISTFPNDEEFSFLYGLHNTGQKGGTQDADIDAPEVWDIQRGSDAIVVAVIDTGVDYTHEDLVDNMWVNGAEIPDNDKDDDGNDYIDDYLGWDFVNNDNDPFDDQGHGTHCSGTIGAVGNNGIGVVGVSWNVSIMPLKFLNSGGSGSTADAISAVEYATMMQVDIMSNSWGGGGFSQALKEAIIAANYDGILFVAAAGNSRSDNDVFPHYPSNYDVPNVIAVAATDRNDDLASFSSYGALSVDLGAPGVDILSSVPKGSCQLCDPTGYTLLSGTSMATPHVAGAAALINANFPGLTIEQLKSRLLARVDPNPALEAITVTGGRLNAYNSLEEDNVPPDAVIDLAAENPQFNSIKLTWTATGDNGAEGTASSYDVRYSTSPIDAGNYHTATKATGEPSPQPPGFTETFTVTGLSHSTPYHFAMKVIDNVGNTSGVSNVIDETTTTPTIIFEDDMESGANGWSSEGLWHMVTDKSHSFSTSWAYNTGDNYDIGDNWGSLTSPVIDLSAHSSAALTFWNWYHTEPWPSWDQRWVQIGVDGVFTNLDQLYGDPMLEWNETTFDISSYAGKSIQIKFFFDTIDGSYNDYEGWYIDDVSVYGDLLEPNTTCSMDADCSDGLDCNGVESCVNGSCQEGVPVVCADDGIFCNGQEECVEGIGCQSSGNPCESPLMCDEDSDTCTECLTRADCEDGEDCTTDECVGGQCANSWPVCGPSDDCCSPDCNVLGGDPDCPCGNGVCETGEDCNSCQSDCIGSDGGGTCAACFKGVCNGDCHPNKEGPECADCSPHYCCGDGTCDQGENQCNCSLDCGDPPMKEMDCSDGIDNDCDGFTDGSDDDCNSSCLPKGAVCDSDHECCSNWCHRGSCK